MLALLACSLLAAAPAIQGGWPSRVQAADGRFPATWCSPDGDDGGLAKRDLATTALAVLAAIADGSTMRAGPYHTETRRAVAWLRAQQDARGRLGLRTDPDWTLDHAIATCALCEAARASSHASLRLPITNALAVLVDHLGRARRMEPELLLWCRMSARSARACEAWWREDPRASAQPAWDSGADRLEAQVGRLVSSRIPDEPRQRAARWALEVLAGPDAEVDLVARLAKHSPSTTDDPLTLLYRAIAAWHTGGATWAGVARELRDGVTATQLRGGEHASTWNPRGSFGAEYGRVGTTLAFTLTLTLYYRYCRLEVAQ